MIHVTENPTADLGFRPQQGRESVPRLICQRSTTGNETGNSYVADTLPETITDTVEIPTANLEFTTTASSKVWCQVNKRFRFQPEVAIWPPKPEIVISLEL